MDWAKAKTILIVAFIITNIFLLINIQQNIDNESFFYKIDDQRIKDVVSILEEKGITVQAEVPREAPKISVLTVEYETYDLEEMADKILGTYTLKDKKCYKEGKSLETSFDNKMLIYKNEPKTFNMVSYDEEQAKKIADAFVKKYGFQREDTYHWHTLKGENGKYDVIYKQKYGHMFLEDSYMKITVDNYQVVEFERKWMKPQNTKTYEKRVIPATKALLMAIDDINARNKENKDKVIITDISLGYLHDISKFQNLIKWYDIKSGIASPYWRICLDNNECIFIEAHE